ncbi:MAG: hypothetical protein JW738_08040 [Actinobacteria bacterium]|nr:hypothetical protein [Actinomycetota bacterium]
MTKSKNCSYCGVPEAFHADVQWTSDGTIHQKWNPDHRRFFYETSGLDLLFKNLKELLGDTIDHIVVEAVRKTTYDYFDSLFSGIKGQAIRALPRKKLYEKVAEMGPTFGIGHLELMDVKRHDYVKIRGRNIYSTLLHKGDLVGIYNSIEGVPAEVHVEENGGSCVFTITAGDKSSDDLSERLERVVLPRKPGELDFKKCPDCGLPLYLNDCHWNIGEGIITDNKTKRNMSLIGPEGLDAIFRELEDELGEDIPRIIIEAQRRYVVDTFKPTELGQEAENLEFLLALRGMGNLVQFILGDDLMQAVVENADPPLMVAGMLEGFFELITVKKSESEYIQSNDGTLEIRIKSV